MPRPPSVYAQIYDAIGELYHLNAQRLAVWDETLPLTGQLPSFQARHQALTNGLAAMITKRDLAWADPDLHGTQKKSVNPSQKPLAGLDGVSRSSANADG